MPLTRRQFLRSTGAASAALMLSHLEFNARAAASPQSLPADVSYRTWEDLYRQQWRWDRVARSSHFVNCWYQSHCAWDVFVKDGMVWREEQAADYPAVRGDTPDFNPRGCQKSAC